MFMHEAHYDIELDTIIRDLAKLNNLRVKLKNLVSELIRLKDKGPILPQEEEDTPKIEELSLDEDENTKKKDEPSFGVKITDQNLLTTVNNVIEECNRVLSHERADKKDSTTEKELTDCIMNVKGVVTMAYPMGLPQSDPLTFIFSDEFRVVSLNY
ncbi:predicted protein [Naegleria gruberi]|uniref:Predicted protein n=1 Tax=Naegleria gruberi TaxID=5762 RepID=D2VBD0_NAEGR|nr:uncharacterized protein NAEGRDRAFT_66170 [Naegleria gruberi]EFC45887.1 predicted protein [Naegleria gruberi]|eukprot:XP_002678631.1 predicted protein [Naegleria gruberi strain NEG-M]